MTCGCGWDARHDWQDCVIHKLVLTEDDKRWLAEEWPSTDCECYSVDLMEFGPSYPCGRCARSLLGGVA